MRLLRTSLRSLSRLTSASSLLSSSSLKLCPSLPAPLLSLSLTAIVSVLVSTAISSYSSSSYSYSFHSSSAFTSPSFSASMSSSSSASTASPSASDLSIVLTTAPSAAVATKITNALLEQRLAACIQQLPPIMSSYVWQGKLETSEELLLLIKTRTALVGDVEKCVKENHSYEVPEIVAVQAQHVHQPYLKWLMENTEKPQKQ